jgi:hypothetical protein
VTTPLPPKRKAARALPPIYEQCALLCEGVAMLAEQTALFNRWEAIAARAWANRCAKVIRSTYLHAPRAGKAKGGAR